MTKWHRIDDFNTGHVCFNHQDSPHIAQLYITRALAKTVVIVPAVLNRDEVFETCRKFSTDTTEFEYCTESIIFTPASQERLFELFQTCWPEILSADIKIELEQLYNYKPDTTIKHVIPERNFPEASEIADLIYLKKKPRKIVVKKLTEGFDPNIPERNGLTPLFAAEQRSDFKTARFLLAYGANPLQRNFGMSDRASAYELAVFSKKEKMVALYNAVLFKPQKSIKQLDLSLFDISENIEGFTVKLATSAGLVESKIFHTKFINPDIEKKLFEIYQQFFQASPVIEHDIKQFFLDEFTGKDKFVETICHNGEIQGINLYEIVEDEKHKDVVFFHISCVLMKKELRGIGLTNPLVFTLAFALQQLFPDKLVVCAYQAISFGSANMVKSLHYFPKYSPFLAQFAPDLIHHIQPTPSKVKGPLLVKKDPLACYSEIEVECIPETKEIPVNPHDLDREMFEKMRGRSQSSEKDLHRGVLIMTLTSDELWNQYATLCKHPLLYVDRISRVFAKSIADKKPMLNQELRLPKNSSVLFKKVIERINAKDILSEMKLTG